MNAFLSMRVWFQYQVDLPWPVLLPISTKQIDRLYFIARRPLVQLRVACRVDAGGFWQQSSAAISTVFPRCYSGFALAASHWFLCRWEYRTLSASLRTNIDRGTNIVSLCVRSASPGIYLPFWAIPSWLFAYAVFSFPTIKNFRNNCWLRFSFQAYSQGCVWNIVFLYKLVNLFSNIKQVWWRYCLNAIVSTNQ